jgi:phage-related protein
MVALTIALVAITRRYVQLTAEIIKESQIESSACFRDFASCPQPHLPTQRECTVLFNAPQKKHVHCISILMYNGDTRKMEFTVEFYEADNGFSPVDRFLDDLESRFPILYKLLQAGLVKLKDSRNHHQPLTENIGDGLFDIRVGRSDIARLIWFFASDRKRIIIVAHGYVKKQQKLKPEDKALALKRKADYERRHKVSG